MDKKTNILYLAIAGIIFIFNIASLASSWYAYVADNFEDNFYLTEVELCVDGGGCSTSSYSSYASDLDDAGFKDEAKKVKNTQAGGGLCIFLLVVNILLTIAFALIVLALMLPAIGDKIPQVTKNPIILAKAPFLILLLIPAQVLAWLFWVALFGGYDDVPDGADLVGGAGLGLTIITILLPPIAFAVAWFVFKENGGVAAAAASTTPAPA